MADDDDARMVVVKSFVMPVNPAYFASMQASANGQTLKTQQPIHPQTLNLAFQSHIIRRSWAILVDPEQSWPQSPSGR
jgi:hypothetical protein